MNHIRKSIFSSVIFAVIYTFCMYHNSASIMFPIMMAAGIWLLYQLKEDRKIFDNVLSSFYVVTMMLVAVSVSMTADPKLIFMNKVVVLMLFLCLVIELFCDTTDWTDAYYIRKCMDLLVRSVGHGILLLPDLSLYMKEKKMQQQEGNNEERQRIVKGVLKGILVAGLLLIIIIPLMMGADAVFENMLNSIMDIDAIFEFLFGDINIIGIGFTFVAVFVYAYGLAKNAYEQTQKTYTPGKQWGNVVTGITIVSIVGIVYVLFSMVTLRGILFAGDIKLPENYTYAQYAREGFFNLLLLAVINLTIVLVCMSKYEKNKIMTILLYIMCACIYVMIFGSAYKMTMYVEAYKLTFLRVMVFWFLGVLAIIMIAVIRYIYRADFSLFKMMVVTFASGYLIVAFAKPDYVVAQYNLSQTIGAAWYEEDRICYSDLSADAFPVLLKYEGTKRMPAYYYNHFMEQYNKMNLRTFNWSLYNVKRAAKKYGSTDLANVTINGYKVYTGRNDVFEYSITKDDVIRELGDSYTEGTYDYLQGLHQMTYHDVEHEITMEFIYLHTDKGMIINWIDVTE